MSTLTEPRIAVRVTGDVFDKRFKYRKKHMEFEDCPSMREMMKIGNVVELQRSIAQALVDAGVAELVPRSDYTG